MHTPGPWEVGKRGRIQTIKNAQGGCTVVVDESAIGIPANARLIAQAPKLLDALLALVLCPDYRGIKTNEMNKAREIVSQFYEREL